ncbi:MULTISPECIES: DUF1304 family protein [unclassified Streptomyces]|uniref:DUF1304 family protein n=1 Tax=unclassified Streptomyces TaxID=2593676 RepID=UPI00073B2692|nr:DUF1304 family protein [Streptomyces sp. AVP053U2]ODA69846.1 hypothetical protein APS67_005965 [Streptomyces sp. AVP053U2]
MSRTVGVPVPAVCKTQSLLDLTVLLLRQFPSRFRGGFGRQPTRRLLRPGDERVHLGELFFHGIAPGHLARCGVHQMGREVHVFFLVCVLVAGLYGGLTTNRRILTAQAVPGALALAAVLLAR